MKITSNFKVHSFILAAALSTSLGFVSPAFATGSWIVNSNGERPIKLGTLGGGNSNASGINDAGQVVGSSYSTIAGEYHAFVTGPDGEGITDLGTLGGNQSSAFGINNAGQVVGRSNMSRDEYYKFHAFIAGNEAGMTDLGTLAGGAGVSEANGINDSQVVGFATTTRGENHAFITGPNGVGMTDLGTLGGDYSVAWGINNSGQAVGTSTTTQGEYHAFITGPGGVGMRDLGTLGGGTSDANGVNDAGQVVGSSYSTIAGEYHAFITGPNGEGMIDLNSLVRLPDGEVLATARQIINSGHHRYERYTRT
jgi:probable HAF family extracellular repeat protein